MDFFYTQKTLRSQLLQWCCNAKDSACTKRIGCYCCIAGVLNVNHVTYCDGYYLLYPRVKTHAFITLL